MSKAPKWWREAVIYHVYLRSFQDTNGDGLGDLPGLLQRLDYLVELGVDAVWLSPSYPSPQADFGYDVADYYSVEPAYGSLDDLAHLRDGLHERGLKLILDFVPNHCSAEHPWFQESLQGRDSAKRDWFIWRDPAPTGGPPNNWVSIFGGSAWKLDEASGQYFLHTFLPEQPDLDWRNPAVKQAMLDVLRHWLEWGCDGFRVDAISRVIKNADMRDNPPDPDYTVTPDDPRYSPWEAMRHEFDSMQPGVLDVVAAMREVTEAYPDKVLIGETDVRDWDDYFSFLEPGRFQLAFAFPLLRANSLAELREGAEVLAGHFHGKDDTWPTLVLSNHDHDRHVTRLRGCADAAADDPLAKLSAAALLLLPGTPFVYMGEEWGLPNSHVPPERLQDPVGKWEHEHSKPWIGSLGFESLGRDPERTPLPWTGDAPGFGFTQGGQPWLPFGATAATKNQAQQAADPQSVLHFYRALIRLRRARPSLLRGSYRALETPDPSLWAFVREAQGEAPTTVLLNLRRQTQPSPLAGPVLFGSARSAGETLTRGDVLQPLEVVVLAD